MRIFFMMLFVEVMGVLHAGDGVRMRELMGLNVHTVQFKPELYAPVTRVLRNYHPLRWDVGEEPGQKVDFPWAKNRVHWGKLYGEWLRARYNTHASVMFDDLAPSAWGDVEREAEAYGRAFAAAFGPGAKEPLLEAAEIGNEPGKYEDALYERLFVGMARGMRAGDVRLRIATCAATLGKSHAYAKSVDCFTKHPELWDILNVHLYAEVEPWPTWRRSYPEDPATRWVAQIEAWKAWRDTHAPGKVLWVTEFGYDATTKQPPKTGDFARWQGNTEEEQAMWLVRSFLLLARHGVERGHVFFFNDADEPQLHGSSGITRNFVPKPAFHALAWLQAGLGEYRFLRVEREDAGDTYAYEFVHGEDASLRARVVWRLRGEKATTRILHDQQTVLRAERMPLTAGGAEAVPVLGENEAYSALEVGTAPVIVWLKQQGI